MKYFAPEQLGPKRSKTPEGFLLCQDVTVARTGVQIYGPGETPIKTGPDGITRIDRPESEVFRPETVASFNGKPVVDEHPDGDVTPENWVRLSKGVTLHPRRGEAAENDAIIADLLIYDPQLIASLSSLEGKRQVSCGYDADYDAVEGQPGWGVQRNIIGNHVALVEAARCGPRCTIGDRSSTHDCCEPKETNMSLKDRIKNAFKAKDEGALTAVLDELPEEGKTAGNTTFHVHVRDDDKDDDKDDKDDKDKDHKTYDALDSRMQKVEDALDAQAADIKSIKDAVMDKKDDDDDDDDKTADEQIEFEAEAPPGTGDKAYKVKDSVYLEDSFQETVALAEIIAPGIGIPTFDRKADRKKTYDTLCSFRRKVLDTADRDPETHVVIDRLTGERPLAEVKRCSDVRTIFRAVGEFKKTANNLEMRGRTQDYSPSSSGGSGVTGKVKTPADLNKRMAEIYKS